MWYNIVTASSKSGTDTFGGYKMNNVIDRKINTKNVAQSNIYNEAFGEKLIGFFCLVIAFFEDYVVDTVCRLICGVAIAVGIFFYVSALMAGTLTVVAIAIYGAALIAASAFVFRIPSDGASR